MNDSWLNILLCVMPALVVTLVAAVLGTRARLKSAAQILASYRQGRYSSPQFRERYWTLLLLQMVALIVFFGVTAFAVVARSLAAAIASGIALTISFVCGYLAGRLMAGGQR